MSVKIRGYRWQMTGRGFEIYGNLKGTHFMAFLDNGVVRDVPATQIDATDGGELIEAIDEFWEAYGR